MTDNLLCATVSVRGVIVNSRGHILILQRTTDDGWELPGGRLGTGEDPVEGLQREIAEETSLSVDIAEILRANSWVNDEGQGRFAVHYHCYASKRTVDLSAEHTDWTWIEPGDVSSILCEPQTAAVCLATGTSTQRQRSTQSSISQD